MHTSCYYSSKNTLPSSPTILQLKHPCPIKLHIQSFPLIIIHSLQRQRHSSPLRVRRTRAGRRAHIAAARCGAPRPRLAQLRPCGTVILAPTARNKTNERLSPTTHTHIYTIIECSIAKCHNARRAQRQQSQWNAFHSV